MLLGSHAAGVHNGRIHPSSEGDVTNRWTVLGVSPLLTFLATGRMWPDLSSHPVGVWDRLSLVFELIPERVEMGYDSFINVLSVCGLILPALWPVFIFVCILSHCGVVAGNKNLLR